MPVPQTEVTAVVRRPRSVTVSGWVDHVPSRLTCTVTERNPRRPRGVVAHRYRPAAPPAGPLHAEIATKGRRGRWAVVMSGRAGRLSDSSSAARTCWATGGVAGLLS